MAIVGKNPRPIKGKVNDKGTNVGNSSAAAKGTARAKISKSSVPSQNTQPKNPKVARQYTKKSSNPSLFQQRYGTGVLNGDKQTTVKGDGGALEDRGNARLSQEISGFGDNKMAKKGQPMKGKATTGRGKAAL